jgi:hypothetical protein
MATGVTRVVRCRRVGAAFVRVDRQAVSGAGSPARAARCERMRAVVDEIEIALPGAVL